jgi:hypothetical protein
MIVYVTETKIGVPELTIEEEWVNDLFQLVK